MTRKIISLHLLALLICLGAAYFASAQCSTCNAGCPDGGCHGASALIPGQSGCQSCAPGGRRLLGMFRHQADCQGGPCRTCDNIWDDYCASKSKCLPNYRYPLQNYQGGIHFLGKCNGCTQGVGIYGGNTCCPHGHGGHLKKLFARKHAFIGHAGECCETGCADGNQSVVVGNPTDAEAKQDIKPATQPVSNRYPVSSPRRLERVEPQPKLPQPSPITLETSKTSAPVAEPAAPYGSGVSSELEVPMPPVPEASSKPADSPNSFDWLQRALQLD